jgi:hypothetical protein
MSNIIFVAFFPLAIARDKLYQNNVNHVKI